MSKMPKVVGFGLFFSTLNDRGVIAMQEVKDRIIRPYIESKLNCKLHFDSAGHLLVPNDVDMETFVYYRAEAEERYGLPPTQRREK